MFVHAQEYPITPNDMYPRKYIQNSLTHTQASPTTSPSGVQGLMQPPPQTFSLEKMGGGEALRTRLGLMSLKEETLVVSGAMIWVHR